MFCALAEFFLFLLHLTNVNRHVSDSRIGGTWCPLEKKERETEKKERKKIIAHGPFNKQYASMRWKTFQKGQRSWSRSMTFLSLAPSIHIAKCKVSMLKTFKALLIYLSRRRQMLQFYFRKLIKNSRTKVRQKNLRHSAWLDRSVFQSLKTLVIT